MAAVASTIALRTLGSGGKGFSLRAKASGSRDGGNSVAPAVHRFTGRVTACPPIGRPPPPRSRRREQNPANSDQVCRARPGPSLTGSVEGDRDAGAEQIAGSRRRCRGDVPAEAAVRHVQLRRNSRFG